MAESLVAQLGLDLSSFTDALAQAQQQFQQFAQQVSSTVTTATRAFTEQVAAVQQVARAYTQAGGEAERAWKQALNVVAQVGVAQRQSALETAAVQKKAEQESAAEAQRAWKQTLDVVAQVGAAKRQEALETAAIQKQAARDTAAAQIQATREAESAAKQAASVQAQVARESAAATRQNILAAAEGVSVFEQLGNQILRSTLRMAAFALIAAPAAGIYALTKAVEDSIKSFADFDAGIQKVGTELPGVTGPQLASIGEQVHTLATTFGKSTEDINKALYEAVAVMGTTDKALAVLKQSGALAVAGQTDFAKATTATLAVLRAYNLDASRTGEVTQALFTAAQRAKTDVEGLTKAIAPLLPQANNLRVNFRDVGAAFGVLTQNSISAGEAVTGLKHLLDDISAPTVRAQKYFVAAGEALQGSPFELKRTKDGLVDLAAAFKQFEGIDPDLLRRVIPSTPAREALLTFIQHMQQLKEELDIANQSSSSLADKYDAMAQTIKAAQDRITQGEKGLKDARGEVIAQSPLYQEYLRGIEEELKNATNEVKRHGDFVTDMGQVYVFFKIVAQGALIAVRETWANVSAFVSSGIRGLSQAIHGLMDLENQIPGVVPVKNFVTSALRGIGVSDELARGIAGLPPAPTADFAGEGGTSGGGSFATARAAPIIGPPAPPRRLGLGDLDVGGKGRASHAAEQAARERASIEEKLRDKLTELDHDEFDAAQKFLDEEVAYARKIGADKLLVDEYYKDQSAKIAHDRAQNEIVELIQGLSEAAKAREEDLKNQQQIADILRSTSAKTTKTQLDDISASYAKQREQFEKLGADKSQRDQLNANESKQLLKTYTEEAQKEQDKQRQAYEKLVSDVAGPIKSVFQNILSGTGTLLDTLKQTFFQFIVELAAEALAKQIVIPILLQVLGGASGGAGTAGTVGQTFSAVSGITGGGGGSSVAGTVGSLGQAGSLFKNILNTPISDLFGGGASTFQTTSMGPGGLELGTGSSAGTSGATVGQAAGAISAGLVVGTITNNFLYGKNQSGAEQTGSVVGGVVVGAIGEALFGQIGGVVGAFLGSVFGAFIGSLFTNRPDPRFQITQAQQAQVSYDPRFGLQLGTPFAIQNTQFKDLGAVGIQGQGKYGGSAYDEFTYGINTAVNDVFQKTINDFRNAAPQIQQAIAGTLTTEFKKLTDELQRYQFHGSHALDYVKLFLTDLLPTELGRDLKPLVEAVQRINPIVQAFNNITKQANEDIVKLQQAAVQQHLSLQTSIVGIQEGLFSPAQQYVAAQKQLQQALGLLSQASPQQQTILIPKIQELTSHIFSLAKNQEVLGQDPQALRNLQTQLTSTLQGLQGTSGDAFTSLANTLKQQADLAQEQIKALLTTLPTTTASGAALPGLTPNDIIIDTALTKLQDIQNAFAGASPTAQQDATAQVQTALLTGQVASLSSIDQTEQAALAVLQSIANSLIGAPGHQSGIRYVPQSGISFLHAGERVVSAHENAAGGGSTINIHIGNNEPSSDRLAALVIKEIEKKGGRLQSSHILVGRTR